MNLAVIFYNGTHVAYGLFSSLPPTQGMYYLAYIKKSIYPGSGSRATFSHILAGPYAVYYI